MPVTVRSPVQIPHEPILIPYKDVIKDRKNPDFYWCRILMGDIFSLMIHQRNEFSDFILGSIIRHPAKGL